MQPHPEIQAELATLNSVLAGYSRRMPFAVPNGYFADAAAVFTDGIHAAEAAADPVLSRATRSIPFFIPEGYFEVLPEQLLEAAVAAVLPQRTQPFAAPAGYFTSLPDTLLAAAKAADAPQVIPVPVPARRSRTLAIPALRWAAAATLVLGIGLGLYRAGTPAAVPATTQRALAALPKKALQDYVLQNIDDFDTDMLAEAGVKAPAALPLDREDVQAYLADDPNLL